MELIHPSQVCS